MQSLQDMQMRNRPKESLHNLRNFIGACILYPCHIHHFTSSSALVTDLIQKTNPWWWTAKEEACFQELEKKIFPIIYIGVPHPKTQIVVITDA